MRKKKPPGRNGGFVRAVLDTNVLLSGLLWHGAPHAVLEQVRAGNLGLVCSPALIGELGRTLKRAKFLTALARSNADPERILADMRLLAEIVDPAPLPVRICRDPDDDAVLALAAAAQVDLIVSGEGDLLALAAYAGISIVTPAQALARLTA